ncbi:hypothetical protein F4802DRAFT_543958 [Xylaria palmicola]|nr:hypothetical protein F4802DRAFT_543958 [Xylaria palmicola]
MPSLPSMEGLPGSINTWGYTPGCSRRRKVLGNAAGGNEKPLVLLREGRKQRRRWFHFILLCGVNGLSCVPFVKLCRKTADWDELVSAEPDNETKAFTQSRHRRGTRRPRGKCHGIDRQRHQ